MPSSRGSSLTQESNLGLWHCRQILQGSPLKTHISASYCLHQGSEPLPQWAQGRRTHGHFKATLNAGDRPIPLQNLVTNDLETNNA